MKNYFYLLLAFLLFHSCKSEQKQESNNSKKTTVDDSQKKEKSQSPPTLFKEYKLGQAMDDFMKTGKYEDCSDFFEAPALCIDGVTFLDVEYSAGLIFKDKKLQKVILYTEYSDDVYKNLPASLSNNDFVLAVLSDENERIDVLQSAQKQSKADFLGTLTTFENRMLSGTDALIGFVETKGLKKDVKQYGTFQELILDLPDAAREVDLRIITDDDGTRYLALTFNNIKNELNGLRKKENF